MDKTTGIKEIAEFIDNERPGYNWFLRNEYFRLTGQWFTPLPCHWWQLEPGIEIELKFKDGKFLDYKDYFEYFDDRGVLRFRNDMFHIEFIKLMRIISYEVK